MNIRTKYVILCFIALLWCLMAWTSLKCVLWQFWVVFECLGTLVWVLRYWVVFAKICHFSLLSSGRAFLAGPDEFWWFWWSVSFWSGRAFLAGPDEPRGFRVRGPWPGQPFFWGLSGRAFFTGPDERGPDRIIFWHVSCFDWLMGFMFGGPIYTTLGLILPTFQSLERERIGNREWELKRES